MSAPVQPVTNQDQSQASNNPPSPTGGQPSSPSQPDIRGELDRLGRQSISELHAQLAESRAREALLQQRLANQAPNGNNAPKAPTGADFINEPVPIMRNVVKEEIAAQIAPLLDLANKLNRNDAYSGLKAQFRNEYPQLGGMLSELEPYVDKLMSGIEPNVSNMMAALTQAAGLKAMGQIPTRPVAPSTMPSNPNPQPATPVTNAAPAAPTNGSMIPPNLPPSPPTLPSTGARTPEQEMQAKIDALTESERRMWVNMGGKLTKEGLAEYIQLRDGGDDVASWYRPQPPKQ